MQAVLAQKGEKAVMTDAEVPQNESVKDGESRVVLVDDLAGEGDYWLSVTDAARVTRRQEITIRRWIAVGELPVRRQRMGLNKRTRHVRARDLAKLTPIIDPSAAITGDVGSLDLTSIPQQQAQIQAAQAELLDLYTQLAHMLTHLTSLQEQDRYGQQRLQSALDVAQAEFAQQITQLQNSHIAAGQRFDAQIQTQQVALSEVSKQGREDRLYEARERDRERQETAERFRMIAEQITSQFQHVQQSHVALSQQVERSIDQARAISHQLDEALTLYKAEQQQQLQDIRKQIETSEHMWRDEAKTLQGQIQIIIQTQEADRKAQRSLEQRLTRLTRRPRNSPFNSKRGSRLE